MSPLLSLVLAAFALTYVAADETTLVVPFVDPQAISAKVVGVDTANTRTTYELFQGAYTGTWSDPEGSFPGTATLVEGADYASFTYVVNDPEDGSFTIGGVCSLGNGQEASINPGLRGANLNSSAAVFVISGFSGSGGCQNVCALTERTHTDTARNSWPRQDAIAFPKSSAAERWQSASRPPRS
uniref:DNase1 protein n=1 Tax=Mycena chlorophos TaxID=658473 RepID=A0ABQ0M433_MYCCL|nr:predicted protein [Mycena chlorophos]